MVVKKLGWRWWCPGRLGVQGSWASGDGLGESRSTGSYFPKAKVTDFRPVWSVEWSVVGFLGVWQWHLVEQGICASVIDRCYRVIFLYFLAGGCDMGFGCCWWSRVMELRWQKLFVFVEMVRRGEKWSQRREVLRCPFFVLAFAWIYKGKGDREEPCFSFVGIFYAKGMVRMEGWKRESAWNIFWKREIVGEEGERERVHGIASTKINMRERWTEREVFLLLFFDISLFNS